MQDWTLLRSQDDGLRGPSIHPAEGHNSRGLVLTPYGSNVTLTPCIAVRQSEHSISLTLFYTNKYPHTPGQIASSYIHTSGADSASSQLNNDTTHVSLTAFAFAQLCCSPFIYTASPPYQIASSHRHQHVP
jgi:hypothetical protein